MNVLFNFSVILNDSIRDLIKKVKLWWWMRKIESSKPRFKSSRMTEKASGRSTFKTFRTMVKKRKKKINRSLSTICII